MIAALCHDVDHRGRDNSYQREKSTPLSTLYSSSIMEHHHFNMTVTILQVSLTSLCTCYVESKQRSLGKPFKRQKAFYAPDYSTITAAP